MSDSKNKTFLIPIFPTLTSPMSQGQRNFLKKNPAPVPLPPGDEIDKMDFHATSYYNPEEEK